jgi:hypothetical protein
VYTLGHLVSTGSAYEFYIYGFNQLQIKNSLEKNSRMFQKAKLEFAAKSTRMKCCIDIVVGIVSNLEIESTCEDVCRLYVNSTSSYLRYLSILKFWYLWVVLESIP